MPLPSEHTQAPILTQWTVFVGHLGFQSITDQYERPCTIYSPSIIYVIAGTGLELMMKKYFFKI